MGEAVAIGVAACLLLEYGVATAAVAVGWSGYVNKLLQNLFGFQVPHALSAAPWDAAPGYMNLPAVFLIGMCALLLIRGASESARVNAIMVVIKLGVLVYVRDHRVHRLRLQPSQGLRAVRRCGNRVGRGHHLLHVHRPGRGVDRGRRGQKTRRRPCRAR